MYVWMYLHLTSLSFEYLVCPQFFSDRYWMITIEQSMSHCRKMNNMNTKEETEIMSNNIL